MVASPLDQDMVERALRAILHRVDGTLEATEEEFPYIADPETGTWETTEDGNWAAGHWIGLLWLASQHSDDPSEAERFAQAAREHTERMCRQAFDNIFMGMGLHYAGFRGYDASGDRSMFGLGLIGADEMLALFDEAARQIPIGEYQVATPGAEPEPDDESADEVAEEFGPEAYAAVDIIYTSLPVLWRAYQETNDPRFRDTAISHADRHLDWHVRDDGSVQQIAIFDAEGTIVRQSNGLGYADDTCWARGQGWNIAGLARAYRETGADRYLRVLERSVDYYTSKSPDDLVPYWDFEDPAIPDAPRDTSAAGLAAYGLARLEGDGDRVAALRTTGEQILDSLISDYLITDPADDRRGMVLHGTFNKPSKYGVDNELIWTDYYVAYTLHSLLRRRVQDGAHPDQSSPAPHH